MRVDTGVRSPHYGDIQRQHQEWLTRKAQQLRLRRRLKSTNNDDHSSSSIADNQNTIHPEDRAEAVAGKDGSSTTPSSSPLQGKPETTPGERDRRGEEVKVGWKTRDEAEGEGQGLLRGAAAATAAQLELKERIYRVNTGARLWGETYVPPIEPARRQELIDKWTGTTRSPQESNAASKVCAHK